MARVLTAPEYQTIRHFKKAGTLQKFDINELTDLTRNGGVAIFCGDGDIDVSRYHRRGIERPHAIKVFGGPLVFCPFFRGYKPVFADKLVENIIWGMEAKKTRSLFLYFHYPCGVAEKFGHSLEDVIGLSLKAREAIGEYDFFGEQYVHSFFHIRRINKAGREEQNTYKFII